MCSAPLANWQVVQEPKISHLIPGRAIDFYYPLISREKTLLPTQKAEKESLSALLQQRTITHFISVLRRQLLGIKIQLVINHIKSENPFSFFFVFYFFLSFFFFHSVIRVIVIYLQARALGIQSDRTCIKNYETDQ